MPMNSDTNQPWWQSSVIYQIYPRSFQDSNGDGIGDLPGITRRLDYLQDLGVDAIWLSPIFRSPMHDFGYDISDYRAIDPVFGTANDFKHLLREADHRRIRIILDGVFNHTSDEHPWFRESRSSTDNPRRDWYIWRRKRNNWRSIFGGPGWEKDDATGEYYFHSFLTQQPDLNWHNPAVESAVVDEIRYWLDQGVSGYRLDVINFFFKDAGFRNNPFGLGPTPRPYDLQQHIYDRNRPELHDLMKRMRSVFDEYDAMMVGEIFSETRDARLAASYLGAGDQLHLSFDFSLMYTPWDARRFEAELRTYHDAIHPDAWPCTVLSNHDQPRSLTRFGKRDADRRARVMAVLLMTVRGTPFLYYGEEIGMTDARIRRRQIVDPLGKRYWPFHPGRDPARTPMQWSAGEHAGFTTAQPWLPVHPGYPHTNVDSQLQDGDSLLAFTRQLTRLRREHPELRAAGLEFAESGTVPPDVLAYRRGDMNIFLNFSHRNQSVAVAGPQSIILSSRQRTETEMSGQIPLQPCEAVICRPIATGR